MYGLLLHFFVDINIPMVNSNGNIFAIYTIMKVNGTVSATRGVDYTPMLEKALKSNITDVVLYQDAASIYAVPGNGVSFCFYILQ